MDSTMIYQLIHQQINKPKELIHLIPTFASFIAPGSKITIDRMNDHALLEPCLHGGRTRLHTLDVHDERGLHQVDAQSDRPESLDMTDRSSRIRPTGK